MKAGKRASRGGLPGLHRCHHCHEPAPAVEGTTCPAGWRLIPLDPELSDEETALLCSKCDADRRERIFGYTPASAFPRNPELTAVVRHLAELRNLANRVIAASVWDAIPGASPWRAFSGLCRDVLCVEEAAVRAVMAVESAESLVLEWVRSGRAPAFPRGSLLDVLWRADRHSLTPTEGEVVDAIQGSVGDKESASANRIRAAWRVIYDLYWAWTWLLTSARAVAQYLLGLREYGGWDKAAPEWLALRDAVVGMKPHDSCAHPCASE